MILWELTGTAIPTWSQLGSEWQVYSRDAGVKLGFRHIIVDAYRKGNYVVKDAIA